MIAFILFELVFFGILLAADLVSKQYVMAFLESGGGNRYVLWDKVLALYPTYNEGAGFSFLYGKTTLLIVITSIGLAAILGVMIWGHFKLNIKNDRNRFLMAALTMMFAGGIGNLVDRIALGSVRDFIEYTVIETLFNKKFPICNVADIWLTLGMILLMIYVIFLWKGDNIKAKAMAKVDETNVQTALYLMQKAEDKLPSKLLDRQDIEEQPIAESEQEDVASLGEDMPQDDASKPEQTQQDKEE